MYVVITGTDCSLAAESLRAELSSKGLACITYDFEEPANQMHDGALIALQQYSSYGVELPVKDVFSEPRDENLVTFCRAWLERRCPCHLIASTRIEFMTKRWQELGMLYFVIVYGDLWSGEDLKFPGAYKINIERKEDNSAQAIKLNDFAGGMIFDQVVDLNKQDLKSAAIHIAASLRAKIEAAFTKAAPEKADDS